jgi:hypothetical protein
MEQQMRTPSLLLAALVASAIAGTAGAADLSKIDRTIAREPTYKGKPKYCLLVFGVEAKYRAWIVIDDESLYVDRNGSGDLTENGKRVPWKKPGVQVGELSFDDGKVRYTNLTIEKRKWWTIEVVGKYNQRVSRDGQGDFAFAERPRDAPIIHFDGPLSMDWLNYCDGKTSELVRGAKPGYLSASIGTPGLGKGTFAFLVPTKEVEALKPLAEIEFLHRDPKEKPTVVSVRLAILEKGCHSFDGPVRVPDEAAGPRAKITLSFADWKEGTIAPRTGEVAITEPKPPGK